MASLQACERQRGDLKCSNHPKNNVTVKCKQCGILVCIDCVSSKEHEGHTFLNLQDCFKKASDSLQRRTWNLEIKLLPKIRTELKATKEDLTLKDNNRTKDVDSVEELRRQTVEDINESFRTYVLLINKHTSDLKKPIENHLTALQLLETGILKQITDCRSILKSGTAIEIHDDEDAFQEKPDLQIPALPNTAARTLPYVKVDDAEKILKRAVVMIDKLKLKPPPPPPPKPCKTKLTTEDIYVLPKSTSSAQPPFPPPQLENRKRTENPYETFTQYTVGFKSTENPYQTLGKTKPSVQDAEKKIQKVTKFRYLPLGWNAGTLCPISRDHAWIQGNKEGVILIDEVSHFELPAVSALQTENLCKVKSLSLHPEGGQLYAAYDNVVSKIDQVSGHMSNCFELNQPINIMRISRDGCILISLCDKTNKSSGTNEIMRYTMKGQLKAKSKRQFIIKDVAECSQTNNLVLAFGEEGVEVVNKDFKTIFSYPPGQTPSAVFDGFGNIIVGTSSCDGRIHLVEGKTGTCLQIIDVDRSSGFETLILLRIRDSVLWAFYEPNYSFLDDDPVLIRHIEWL